MWRFPWFWVPVKFCFWGKRKQRQYLCVIFLFKWFTTCRTVFRLVVVPLQPSVSVPLLNYNSTHNSHRNCGRCGRWWFLRSRPRHSVAIVYFPQMISLLYRPILKTTDVLQENRQSSPNVGIFLFLPNTSQMRFPRNCRLAQFNDRECSTKRWKRRSFV